MVYHPQVARDAKGQRWVRKCMLLALLIVFFATDAGAQDQPRAQRPRRAPDRLQAGSPAPDFTLKSPDGKRTEKLSDYRGKKPVALVFGSYT